MSLPEPLYRTRDGNVAFYDQASLDEYLSGPQCAFKEKGELQCPERSWVGNYRQDAFPKEYEQFCFMCAFWQHRASFWYEPDDEKGRITVKSPPLGIDVYTYDKKEPMVEKTDRGFLGFGGTLWRIEYLDTYEVVMTNNLWHGGDVPVRFHDLFPVNARLYNKTIQYRDMIDLDLP